MKSLTQKFYTLLYEDTDMVAVSKNHGVYVVQNRQNTCQETLVSILNNDFGKIYPIHRLDAGTGGVMIYAKNHNFHKSMCNLFEERKISKNYIAISQGHIYDQTLMLPIAKGSGGKFKINFKSGKNSVTSFLTLTSNDKASIIKATPFTGRTHQIRVHLKALKAPLLYDWVYNSRIDDKRLSLFAKDLSFINPNTGKLMKIEAPYSDFMLETAHFLELSLKDVY